MVARPVLRRWRPLLGFGLVAPALIVALCAGVLVTRSMAGRSTASGATGASGSSAAASGGSTDGLASPGGGAWPATTRRRLTRSIEQTLAGRSGRLSVAIRDRSTGAAFTYGASRSYVTASIVKVDILAALLLRAQRDGRSLTALERSLATRMITVSDNDAAGGLWRRIGGSTGLDSANRVFSLRRTVAGTGGYWGLTRTTVTDQIRLLATLTGHRGRLSAARRSYALRLMRQVTAGQDWGVSAAAGDGDVVALKNGWLSRAADGGTWVINSIGTVSCDGHRYLIAVLSDHNPTMAAGIATVEQITTLVTQALHTS